MILAATVAGLARYMDAWLDPIRPGKFRLVLLMQVSPGAMIPSWAPRQAPHPGVVMVAPAFIKSCMYPFSIQESMTSEDAGTTTSLLYGGMCLPFTILAATAISSSRPPVQLPMYP